MCTRVLLVMVCSLLGACTLIKPPVAVSMQSFVLDNPAITTASPAPTATDPVLVIAELRSRPGYETPRMAYVKRDYALDYYASSQWADTPAHMLQPLLVNALDATGRYSAVLRAPAPVAGELRLEAEIVRFEQVFSVHPSRMHISLRVQFIDAHQGKVLGTRQFDAELPSPSEDAYGGVRAANQALAPILKEVAAFCVSLTPQ
jgi:cholesterol transport system auxiliary component